MIFVTVGSLFPFRRLVQAADEWAQDNPSVEVLAQVGSDTRYLPIALKAFSSVTPARFAEIVEACELVVAHAGMGSVLTALEHGKPMLLMPRRAALQETTSDHQVATLRWLQQKPGIHPAADEAALKAALDVWRNHGLAAPAPISDPPDSLDALVESVRSFIG